MPLGFQIALACFVLFFLYIIAWTVVAPLFEPSNPIHGYFYPQKYFFTGVAMFFVTVVTILVSFIDCVFINDNSVIVEREKYDFEKKSKSE